MRERGALVFSIFMMDRMIWADSFEIYLGILEGANGMILVNRSE